jgi:ADP-dependent NAD(P)H-hydrate dehydratase / NAD(P)H-hydrate epimerase
MLILNAEQLRASDKFTIETEKILSADLMERAAQRCFDWIGKHLPGYGKFAILCGTGNNGGDGWAIARLLKLAGKEVKVFALNGEKLSQDNAVKKAEYLSCIGVFGTLNEAALTEISSYELIIDALFGNGLNRPLVGDNAGIINEINRLNILKIAIDIPSGFFADGPMPHKAVALKADITLSFHAPKLMFFLEESAQWLGEWHILDIGLKVRHDAVSPKEWGTYKYTLSSDFAGILPASSVFAHKRENGHALLVGGTKGKMGAMTLASRACLRSGVGLCTVFVPAVGLQIIQTSVPEAMAVSSESGEFLSGNVNTQHYSAIGFGPGAGKHDETGKLLKYLIQTVYGNLLVDADGLNLLSENQTWLSFLPPNSVLTPHVGELERLCGKASSSFESLENAKKLSLKTGAVVVLKGAYTAVCSPTGAVYFNSTGNHGMAKGGSGDVLSGIITALLAQGLDALNASRLGVFMHGLAGDFAAEDLGKRAMNAGDLVTYLPKAWKALSAELAELNP